jgi:hypothetical protein
MSHRLAALIFLIASTGWSYTAPPDKAGPLTMSIQGPQSIVSAAPAEVEVTLPNASGAAVAGTPRAAVVDDWKGTPGDAREFGAAARFRFTATPAAASYPAHYPIHFFADFTVGGSTCRAHPVLIVQSAFSGASPRASARRLDRHHRSAQLGLRALAQARAARRVAGVRQEHGHFADCVGRRVGNARRDAQSRQRVGACCQGQAWRLAMTPGTVKAVAESGAMLSRGPALEEGGEVVLPCDPSIFAYRLR